MADTPTIQNMAAQGAELAAASEEILKGIAALHRALTILNEIQTYLHRQMSAVANSEGIAIAVKPVETPGAPDLSPQTQDSRGTVTSSILVDGGAEDGAVAAGAPEAGSLTAQTAQAVAETAPASAGADLDANTGPIVEIGPSGNTIVPSIDDVGTKLVDVNVRLGEVSRDGMTITMNGARLRIVAHMADQHSYGAPFLTANVARVVSERILRGEIDRINKAISVLGLHIAEIPKVGFQLRRLQA